MHKLINQVFAVHVVLVGLVLAGIVPREVILLDLILVSAYLLYAPLEDGLIFFARSIPLFIALPLTETYDNLNMWRIFSILLFLKWLFSRQAWHYVGAGLILLYKRPRTFIKEHSWLMLSFGLLVLAIASVFVAPDKATALKRVVFFINASIIGLIITHPPHSKQFVRRLIRNITIPVIIVTLVGLVQVVSTYFIDIYQFMRIWGEGIQLREFGTVWSYIAVNVGNTWFAYFGDQLSLRVFSLFPDSHSFPIFLLLGLPTLYAWSLSRPLERASRFKDMLHTRGSMTVLWVPLVFLMMILSGTRGIWAGGLAMVIWAGIVSGYMRFKKIDREHRNTFKYLAAYLIGFFLLFAVAYPIFSSPQFLVSKGDNLLLERRLRSILDFGETSNSQRIDIWKKSLVSIGERPILGVGIGNYPIVLGQDIILGKAGSSAHNIYLHIAAEMGIIALMIFLWWILLVLKRVFDHFVAAKDSVYRAYFGGLLITFPWVLAYLMTDITIFDERALLLGVITLAIVASPITSHE